VEKPQAIAPTSAGRVLTRKSRKNIAAQTSDRKIVNVPEKVQDSETGRVIASHVEGWKTPAWATPRRGLPPSTKRFQNGRRPLTKASRTAALHGSFANGG